MPIILVYSLSIRQIPRGTPLIHTTVQMGIDCYGFGCCRYRKQQHILGLPDFLGWHVEGSHSSHVPDPLTSLERCFVKLAQHAVTTDTQASADAGSFAHGCTTKDCLQPCRP